MKYILDSILHQSGFDYDDQLAGMTFNVEEVYRLNFAGHTYFMFSMGWEPGGGWISDIRYSYIFILDITTPEHIKTYGFQTLADQFNADYNQNDLIPDCINDYNRDGKIDFWIWDNVSTARMSNIKAYTIDDGKIIPDKKHYITEYEYDPGDGPSSDNPYIDLKRSHWFFDLRDNKKLIK